MTYIASARKWRPRKFEELLGQDHIRRTLSNALGAGRIAPAYLFSGTRGVGKTTTARILAKALNCESSEGPVSEPCGSCAPCQEIDAGRHPDVLEIDGATYTGVDHIRDLCEGLRYRPARGRYKTVIIDEVHMLSRGAFNALLKTLEEPPPHVAFVFATTELQKVPETILSRCQVFEFRRFPVGVIKEQLAHIVQTQEREVEEAALFLIARMGEGSMRDAQSLLDQALTFSGEGRLSLEDAEAVLGVPPAEVYRKIVSAVVARDARAALCELGGVFDAGHDLRLFCTNLLEYLRDIMVILAAGDVGELFEVGQEELAERKTLAGKVSFEEAHQAYSILQSAEAELRTSANPRMTMELAVLRMAMLGSLADLGGIMERLDAMSGETRREGGGNRPAGPPPHSPLPPAGGKDVKSPPPPPAESPSPSNRGGAEPHPADTTPPVPPAGETWDPPRVKRAWEEAVGALGAGRRSILKNAWVDCREEGRISLKISPENGLAASGELIRDALPAVEGYMAERLPWPAKVIFEEEAPSLDAPGAARGADPDPAEAKSRKEGEDAIIQEVVDLFDGRIISNRKLRSHGGHPQGGK